MPDPLCTYKQFHFKQFSLAKVQFSSIWPMDRTLSGATTPSQSGPGSDSNEEVLRIPKAPALKEFYNQIVSCLIQDTIWWGGLTSQQRSSRCILQPQPTGKSIYGNAHKICRKSCSYCDVKLTKIPKRDFIFARVKTGQVGTWSPTEISPVQSSSLSHIRTGILHEGII